MSVMNKEVYEAFVEAGTTPEKATEAATSVADYKEDINRVNHKLAMIHGDLTILKWGVGLIIAVVVLPYLKVLLG
jgi:hypothetical protein